MCEDSTGKLADSCSVILLWCRELFSGGMSVSHLDLKKASCTGAVHVLLHACWEFEVHVHHPAKILSHYSFDENDSDVCVLKKGQK